MAHCLEEHDYQEQGIGAKKDQEIFVVSVAKAVVDERAVVIEKFDAAVACEAVERGF